ncbi:MAG TPA: ATP-binding cassette domain-containing protein [Candidatus Hydrogenedentes bacterium]|nr:ATP-binding cassette domain-containing protein [Candidatus Hydrogenedentota bacterium]HRK33174.1 ATP-binding cassette domain-containing protein [Candidatus Hydrogenedentota bacterium]
MIEVTGLTKVYGAITAVHDLSFRVEKGEIIGFLGPNGAGKSTTMRILTGFTPPTSGVAKVAGFHIEDQPVEVKRRVGYMPENVPAYTEMLVGAFLRYAAEVKGIARGSVKSEVDRVIRRCGLTDMSNRIIRNLSKGYRQRLGLAQALIGNPPVLILDEPTSGLDPRQIVDIRQVIKELAPEHTVLLSTHILPEVAMVCERVIIINRGHIVAQDTMHNLTGGDTERIEVEATGVTETIVSKLRALEGVTGVETLGNGRYQVMAPRGADLRGAIVAALSSADCGLAGIQLKRRTLEEVFINAVSSDQEMAV